MSSATTSSSSGIGLGGLLFLLFVALKLTHVIAWSWWWVTAPLWIPFLVIGVPILVLVALAVFAQKGPFATKPRPTRVFRS